MRLVVKCINEIDIDLPLCACGVNVQINSEVQERLHFSDTLCYLHVHVSFSEPLLQTLFMKARYQNYTHLVFSGEVFH